jgi:hypothetical protein
MTTPSDVTVSDQHGETWTRLPAPFSKYEVSPDGFGPDQRPVRRAGAVTGLATTPNNHGDYPMVKVYDDTGRRQTKTVHSLVLLGFDGPPPPGLESRHLDDDPLNNRWRPGATRDERIAAGGNLMYGDKAANTRDKAHNGRPAAVAKTHPCLNHARCGGMVANPGRRCLPCAKEVGRQAAALLAAGENLEDVTARLGYQTPEWVHKLARNHGGYTGTLAQAKAQHPPWTRRVTHRAAVTLRSIFGRDGS